MPQGVVVPPHPSTHHPLDSARLPAETLWSLWDALVRAQARALPYVHKRLYDEHGLTLSEFTVLQHADSSVPATMTQLQQGAAMSASGITRVVGALIARGLVAPLPSGSDRRWRRVEPTSTGRELLDAARETAEAAFAVLLPPNLGSRETAVLIRILDDLGNRAPADLAQR